MAYDNFDMKKIFSDFVIWHFSYMNVFLSNAHGQDDISKTITKKMLIQLYII